MNLRILVYLNPSNIDKVTHKFLLDKDSGFLLVKNTILAVKEPWHWYVLVPDVACWKDKPNNVTLIKYPYINDALNSRFHFDANAILDAFNSYRQDIDLVWTMLPEHAGALKAVCNKRREEIPVFSYINWMDYKTSKGYEPSYLLRMLDGIENSDAVGIQSNYMLSYMQAKLAGYKVDYNKMVVIHPSADDVDIIPSINNIIAFNHRVSTESGFYNMWKLCETSLNYPMWVSNINNAPLPKSDKLIDKSYDNREDYYKFLSTVRFGVSYHVNYSMWSMSVMDMMSLGKVVLVPNKNAFPEMFPANYPYFYDNDKEFLEKLVYLQNCSLAELEYWGNENRITFLSRFTWDATASQIVNVFYGLIGTGKTDKTLSVLKQIQKYGAISKGDLINKNITDYHRLCSRAWNKTRIELFRDFGIKDDVTKPYTLFYVDSVDVTAIPHKTETTYDAKQRTNKDQLSFDV